MVGMLLNINIMRIQRNTIALIMKAENLVFIKVLQVSARKALCYAYGHIHSRVHKFPA